MAKILAKTHSPDLTDADTHSLGLRGTSVILTKCILVILQYSLSLGINMAQMALFK